MYKKIDIYLNRAYLCSTNQARTCKEAKEKIENLKGSHLLVVPHGFVDIPKDSKITAFYPKR